VSRTAAAAAVAGLLRDEQEWRQFFRRCCKTSGYRLAAQAWQFRDELAERGKRFRHDEVEDALLILARRLLPNTPAAAWDSEWAEKINRDAIARLSEHYAGLTLAEKSALDLASEGPWIDRMEEAGRSNDPVAYREALKGWEREILLAIERLRQSPRGARTASEHLFSGEPGAA
jgi:hypothetical protein